MIVEVKAVNETLPPSLWRKNGYSECLVIIMSLSEKELIHAMHCERLTAPLDMANVENAFKNTCEKCHRWRRKTLFWLCSLYYNNVYLKNGFYFDSYVIEFLLSNQFE